MALISRKTGLGFIDNFHVCLICRGRIYLWFMVVWICITCLTFIEVNRRDIGVPARKDFAIKIRNGHVCSCEGNDIKCMTRCRRLVRRENLRSRVFRNLNGSIGLSDGAPVYDTIDGFFEKAKTNQTFLEIVLGQTFLHRNSKDRIRCYLTGEKYDGYLSDLNDTTATVLKKEYDMNSDVIVFLHIQKTGGTFFNNLIVKYATKLPFPCDCSVYPCACNTRAGHVWLYTWVLTGFPCGLHADWTQLHRCLPETLDKMEGKQRVRRYFYITQLRDPVRRYVSEWRHVSKGRHWQDAILGCGTGIADWSDIRPCFCNETWQGVTLVDFMECPYNLATNRQTRMLADLTLTDCYRRFQDSFFKKKRAHSWVKSAIENLKSMEYFGMLEEQEASNKLFNDVFGFNPGIHTRERMKIKPKISEEQFLRIITLVELDIHVYMFARELHNKRLHGV